MTIERENREEIHQKQGKYPWITGTLTVYHYFSSTEFLPCFFFKLNLFLLPGGAFGQNIYPWHFYQMLSPTRKPKSKNRLTEFIWSVNYGLAKAENAQIVLEISKGAVGIASWWCLMSDQNQGLWYLWCSYKKVCNSNLSLEIF